ncbi:MAG: DUF481 domain-containing protein [Aeromonadaceae bacterium]|nr:DUF481 domain-containing protein [Aeromonadaceae bacterium]MBP8773065.1 DUF481 domain-containing protein [Aeromonadaceae bacterium]
MRSRIGGWLLLVLVHPVAADTLWLNNGDRLTGKIEILHEGKLAFSTQFAGTLQINWTDVKRIESQAPLLIELAPDQQPPSAGASLVEFKYPQQQRTLLKAQVAGIKPPAHFSPEFNWRGNLDLSLDIEREEDDSDNLRLKSDNEFIKGYWRDNLDGAWETRKTNGVRDRHNYNLNNSLDYFWSSHWFWRGEASYQRDFHDDLYQESKYGSGPGYRFYDNKSGRFELGATFGHQAYLYHSQNDLSFAILTFSWDYRRFLLDEGLLELYTHGQYSYPDTDEVDYALTSEAGMRIRLTKHLRSTFSSELESLQSTQESHNDWKHFVGLGYSW